MFLKLYSATITFMNWISQTFGWTSTEEQNQAMANCIIQCHSLQRHMYAFLPQFVSVLCRRPWSSIQLTFCKNKLSPVSCRKFLASYIYFIKHSSNMLSTKDTKWAIIFDNIIKLVWNILAFILYATSKNFLVFLTIYDCILLSIMNSIWQNLKFTTFMKNKSIKNAQ